MFNANEGRTLNKARIPEERNYSGVEEEHSFPLRLGDHPRSRVAKVK